jgi:hypothetical protein
MVTATSTISLELGIVLGLGLGLRMLSMVFAFQSFYRIKSWLVFELGLRDGLRLGLELY